MGPNTSPRSSWRLGLAVRAGLAGVLALVISPACASCPGMFAPALDPLGTGSGGMRAMVTVSSAITLSIALYTFGMSSILLFPAQSLAVVLSEHIPSLRPIQSTILQEH